VTFPLIFLLACRAPSAPEASSGPGLAHFTVEGPTSPGGASRRLVVREGRLFELAAEAPPQGELLRVDLITPGFIDAHAHPGGLGDWLAELDLTGAGSLAEVVRRVAGVSLPAGEWLLGRGWDQNDWSDAPAGGFPSAADLDAVTGDRPAALRRVDGHALWLNSAALRAAKITKDTPDPPGGRILRDGDGAPTGVLLDNAMDLVPTPEPSAEERARRLRGALLLAAHEGLVGVHDMGVDDALLAAYTALDDAGELPIRVWVYLTPESAAAKRLYAEGPWRGRRLEVVGVKLVADGALGSRGAHLSTPYADDPKNLGLTLTRQDEIGAVTRRALSKGAQVAVHAIGDAAVSDTLAAFAQARDALPGAAAVPLRLEHAQVVRPEDWALLKTHNVVASMQPTHATSDMPWAEARLGPERVHWSYAWRAPLDLGVVLAFGSDFPVENVSPSYGLWSATTRMSLDGAPPGGWRPEHRLSVDETITAFTRATYAALGRGEGGEIEDGAVADLTLWRAEPQAAGVWYEPVAVLIDGVMLARGD
jgi:predicted amidohydrolase YtcJ